MAFTGTPVVKRVSDSLIRITGVSLAASAVGTISLFEGAGEILLPDDFNPTVYAGVGPGGNVTLQDSLELSHLPAQPITIVKSGTTKANWLATLTNINTDAGPAGGSRSAMFYGTTTGTGSEGNDYAATVAVGAAVPFPRSGPAVGAGIVAGGTNQFVLPVAGIYRVSWAVGIVEASQLQAALGGVAVANTCTISGAGTQENVNSVLISATAGQLLSIINPAGNAAALTIQPADGSRTHAQAPSLNIALVSALGAPAATAALEIYVRHH